MMNNHRWGYISKIHAALISVYKQKIFLFHDKITYFSSQYSEIVLIVKIIKKIFSHMVGKPCCLGNIRM